MKAKERIWAQIDPQVAGSNQMNSGEAELTALVELLESRYFWIKKSVFDYIIPPPPYMICDDSHDLEVRRRR